MLVEALDTWRNIMEKVDPRIDIADDWEAWAVRSITGILCFLMAGMMTAFGTCKPRLYD